VARSRSNSLETSIAQLSVLLVVACVFSPFLRGLLLWGVIAVVAALVAAVVYRFSARGPKCDGTNRLASAIQSPRARISAASQSTLSAQHANVKALDWFQFEKLIAVVYEQQGYSVERFGGANPDGGIDLILTKPEATFAVQCKHWKSWKIGVKQVREFLGALADRGIQNGIFVTLQEYTSEAKQLAARHQIQLIGETELMQMLENVDWRFNPGIIAILNDTRKTCPKCESEMVQRTAKKGGNVGQRFWGCSKYPSAVAPLPLRERSQGCPPP
jgi:hypothetical protein